jgi:signal peptide peptidase SppA
MLANAYEVNKSMHAAIAAGRPVEQARRTAGELPIARAATSGEGPAGRADPFIRAGTHAVIPIDGYISYGDCPWWMQGGTPNPLVVRALADAADDETIEDITLDLNTPGGDVAGISDLVAALAAARAAKPVYALVHDMAASAGYWLAACCSEIIATPSSSSGSIGVIAAVHDTSRDAEMHGVKVHVITTGAMKSIGHYGTEIDESMLAHERGLVEQMAADFYAAVTASRPLSDEQLGAMQGALYYGQGQIAAGLVDRIMPAADFYAALIEGGLQTTHTAAGAANENPKPAASAAKETPTMPKTAAEELNEQYNAMSDEDKKEFDALRSAEAPEEEETQGEETTATTEETSEEEPQAAAPMTTKAARAVLEGLGLPQATVNEIVIAAVEENLTEAAVLKKAIVANKSGDLSEAAGTPRGGESELGGGSASAGSTGSAKAKIEQLVTDRMKSANLDRSAASRAVLKENPSLRDEMVKEANAAG